MPGATRTVAPGLAALIAAWMDWPGRTWTSEVDAAEPLASGIAAIHVANRAVPVCFFQAIMIPFRSGSICARGKPEAPGVPLSWGERPWGAGDARSQADE